MYLDEVNEEDNRITDAWKEDSSSIVVFVGLNLSIVRYPLYGPTRSVVKVEARVCCARGCVASAVKHGLC